MVAKHNKHKHNLNFKHSEENKHDEKHVKHESDFFGSASKKFFSAKKKVENYKYTNFIITGFLIFVLILITVLVRVGPASLPVTDIWAEGIVSNNIKQNIAAQISSERPNLPESSVIQLTEQQYTELYKENRVAIDANVYSLSSQYKALLQNDKGMTYLLGIDEYLFYSYAKWYDRNGHFGTDIVDGQKMFMHRHGHIGQPARFVLESYPIYLLKKVVQPFNSGFDIEFAAFWVTVVMVALSSIPLFFMARKVTGNAGAFVASVLVLTSGTLVGRTLAGAPDSDVYTFLFPFIITYLFFESLGKSNKTKIILASLAALANAFFMWTWSGWWFTFLFIIGGSVLYILFEFVRNKYYERKSLNKNDWINISIFPVVFIVGAIVFAGLVAVLLGGNPVNSMASVVNAPIQPVNLMLGFKSAAEGTGVGGYALWPNVLRTVAELNPASLRQVIGGSGYMSFLGIIIGLFYLGLIGVLTLFFRYKENPVYLFYGLFLSVWILGMTYVGTTAIRFIALSAIPVAIGVGAFVSFMVGPFAKKINKMLGTDYNTLKVVIGIILILIIVWLPIKSANAIGDRAVPIFDDAWYETIYYVRDNTDERAVISSWWDYGHFFQAYGERTVTFDGGDQGKRIYWIGRTLLTDDSDESRDILRMLSCGQEESYNVLQKHVKDPYKSTNIMMKIIRMGKNDGYDYLLANGLTSVQANEVLNWSHCSDPSDMILITSQDMVGKASVWGHFGGWDFNKAYFYYHLKNMPLTQVYTLSDELNMSQDEIRAMYNQVTLIKNENEAAAWISEFPNYLTSNNVVCNNNINSSGVVVCNFNVGVGQQQGMNVVLTRGLYNVSDPSESVFVIQLINPVNNAVVGQNILKPNSVVYEENGLLQEFKVDSPGFGYDFVVFNENGLYKSLIVHPKLSKSLFTRLFFMEGRGVDEFEKIYDVTSFRGERIITWKVKS